MNTVWTFILAGALLIAVGLATFFVLRARFNRPDPVDTTGPTPDGPGYEDGDPMPHRQSRPVGDFPVPPRIGRPIRSDGVYGGGSSTARRMTGDQRARGGAVPDPIPANDPTSPYYHGRSGSGLWTNDPDRAVDTPRDDTASHAGEHTPPSWGGYSGGGYSSGHSSDSGGSSYGGSSSSGSDSGSSSSGGAE